MVEDSASHRTWGKTHESGTEQQNMLESCNLAVVKCRTCSYIAPYTPIWNGHGSHRILHCYHKRLQLFREFLRLCIRNRCSPSHSQMISRSSMISLFPLPTFPTWHQDHHEAAAHLWLLCKLHRRCLAFVRRFAPLPGWINGYRASNLVPSMWQGDRLSKGPVFQKFEDVWPNLMMFEPCSQNGAPGNTWSNFWIHPWKLTAGYPKWCFFSQFSISFQIWYLCQISGV